MNKRSRILQSPKYLQKKRRKSIAKTFLYVTCACSLIIAFIYVLRLPSLQISTINVSGAASLDSKQIQNEAKSVISGNYLGFIPKSSFLFYPKSQIKEELDILFKQIGSIDIRRQNLGSIEIAITEHFPRAIVCQGFKEDDQNDCFYSDENGYIFEKLAVSSTTNTTKFSNIQYFKYYLNSASNSIEIGQNFIESQKFSDLQKFAKNINDNGIQTQGILIDGDGNYELYVRNVDQSSAVVYFNDKVSFDKTASNLLAFWQNVMSRKNEALTIPIFDYINLRFGNNIFYLTK